jgi:murein DD-endopeptidase MepM/ murein hydrolase activator NlpD
MADNKQRVFFDKLKSKYKLAIFNEQTYEEVIVLRLSRLNVFTIVGASAILLIVLVSLLIAFTGLREYIPGYPNADQRLMIVRNAQRVDSLFIEIERRNKFIDNMQNIIRGDVPDDSREDASEEALGDASGAPGNAMDVEFKRSEEDSLFRALVEKEEKYNLLQRSEARSGTMLENTFFFSPIKGMVVNRFGDPRGHFGVDIVAGPGARVSAVMDGVVVISGLTVETGSVIL